MEFAATLILFDCMPVEPIGKDGVKQRFFGVAGRPNSMPAYTLSLRLESSRRIIDRKAFQDEKDNGGSWGSSA